MINSVVGIIDDTGIVIACSDESIVGSVNSDFQKLTDDSEQCIAIGEYLYRKIFIRNKMEYVVFMKADDHDARKIISLISVNFINMKAFHDEKYDRNSFIKDVLHENISQGEIAIRAKELHVLTDINRVAVLIKYEKARDLFVYDIIQGMFPNRTKDFIIQLNDENIVLIKELKPGEGYKEVENTAKSIVDTMLSESMVKTYVAIGTIVGNLVDLKRSLTESQTALKICEIFENEKSVAAYNNLGLGRLIYELPDQVCRVFLSEVFRAGPLEHLDSEILFTIQKFFENNLNVSETSRQLYVHRNTLVYRLDKIQKLTGLDLRKFDDAIIFKFAMLVKRYVDNVQK
ncbi:MAG TPA: helix-turn-helix domain-containing protein [Clostridia bacterium]|nr:helix-turn-helix domain-containing protein [Clostridia bacterium]